MSSKTKTTDAKVAGNPGLLPKLRFPGFDKPWSYDPLSKALKEHKIKNTAGRDVFSVSMEYGIVNQIELLGRSFAAADTSHYTIGRQFDVVYTKSPLKAFPYGIVKQCKFNGEVALSPLYGVFTPANPHLGLMIEAYFESPNRSKDFLSPLCQKGAKNTLQITNTTFLSGRLPLPTQPTEQQRIAECLSSVDNLIAAQARKVDALKLHKNGLMQQLFPREGETQPRLRFPEFKNAGEWEEDTLENLCTAKISYGIVQAGPHIPNGMPYIKSSDLNSELCLASLARTSDVIAKKYRRSEVMPGDIVFSLRGNIGVAQIVPKDIPVANLTQGTARIRTQGPSEFFFQALRSQSVHGRILAVRKGSTFQEISLEALRNIRLLHPAIAEQKRVADCLSTLDTLITAQTQKFEALKIHKKGLIQQLFPSMEVVKA
ncbi:MULTISPECIES: restriction endonuclease subunit S [Pseudomonas]|uniref:restriction endonuclease subunit S n=1 Tax=Pseudomonas TaxID=286 RepID=UPI0010714F64|nr:MULTISPECIES: restriction endonuclease subunit S [Pseudomonas]QBR29667.1 restriction endonuclease subunit S [Pseudomonas sp. S150]UZT93160.1 restriction endonuclease subunit S [Pseudomonas koreensis]